jgi:hypothetical protein
MRLARFCPWRLHALRPLLLLVALGLLAPEAAAQQGQQGGFVGTGRFRGRENLESQRNAPIPRTPASQQVGRAEPWPRLDPGAVFCRSAADLERRLQALRARARGSDDVALLTDNCVVISARTPIEIVERRGMGRTQVRITAAPGATGWTDAWLPERRPGG